MIHLEAQRITREHSAGIQALTLHVSYTLHDSVIAYSFLSTEPEISTTACGCTHGPAMFLNDPRYLDKGLFNMHSNRVGLERCFFNGVTYVWGKPGRIQAQTTEHTHVHICMLMCVHVNISSAYARFKTRILGPGR